MIPSKGSKEEVFLGWGDEDCFSELAAPPVTTSLVHPKARLLGISEVRKPKSAWPQRQQHFLSHASLLLLWGHSLYKEPVHLRKKRTPQPVTYNPAATEELTGCSQGAGAPHPAHLSYKTIYLQLISQTSAWSPKLL